MDPGFNKPSLATIRGRSYLSKVEAAFRRTLGYNPANRTVLQRQTEVAILKGEIEQPLAILESARFAGEEDEVSRFLYRAGSPDCVRCWLGGIASGVSNLVSLLDRRGPFMLRRCLQDDSRICTMWRINE